MTIEEIIRSPSDWDPVLTGWTGPEVLKGTVFYKTYRKKIKQKTRMFSIFSHRFSSNLWLLHTIIQPKMVSD